MGDRLHISDEFKKDGVSIKLFSSPARLIDTLQTSFEIGTAHMIE